MSYILDALNKSEQERQQREHGVSLQPLTGVPHPGNGNARWLPLAAVAIVIAAIGIFAAVYFLMKVKTPPPQLAQPAQVAPAAPVVTPAPVPASNPVNPAPVAAVASAPAAEKPVAPAEVARTGTSDSVKSLYQRKGMPAEQAMAQAASGQSRTAPIAESAASDDVVKTGAAVKTFDADKTASVQTQDAATQSAQPASAPPAAEKSTVNQKALDTELARERESARDAELAARVQAELERMQAQDAKEAAKRAVAVAKARPVQSAQSVSKSQPVQPASVSKQAASAAPAPAVDPDANVPLATQLAADIQKRIPNINFDAHVYAGKTNNGFVILNDKKRYPGDTVAAGLTVERITEDGVILNLSGTRFKLNSMSSWIN